MNNTIDHQISLQEAITMTTFYRANRPDNYPFCETFDVDTINSLLQVEGCASLRFYLGMKPDQQVDFILVAVDADGNDILPATNASATTGDGIIIEDGFRCPPACPTSSQLLGN